MLKKLINRIMIISGLMLIWMSVNALGEGIGPLIRPKDDLIPSVTLEYFSRKIDMEIDGDDVEMTRASLGLCWRFGLSQNWQGRLSVGMEEVEIEEDEDKFKYDSAPFWGLGFRGLLFRAEHLSWDIFGDVKTLEETEQQNVPGGYKGQINFLFDTRLGSGVSHTVEDIGGSSVDLQTYGGLVYFTSKSLSVI